MLAATAVCEGLDPSWIPRRKTCSSHPVRRVRAGPRTASAVRGSMAQVHWTGSRGIGGLRTSGISALHGRDLHVETELHERDRLKHAGRLGEVQTVKVVENGEGGTKRVWKPATRNRNHRDDSPRPVPPGTGWCADPRGDRTVTWISVHDALSSRREPTIREGTSLVGPLAPSRADRTRDELACERVESQVRRATCRGSTTVRRDDRSEATASHRHTPRSAAERDRRLGTPKRPDPRIWTSRRSWVARRGRWPSGHSTPSTLARCPTPASAGAGIRTQERSADRTAGRTRTGSRSDGTRQARRPSSRDGATSRPSARNDRFVGCWARKGGPKRRRRNGGHAVLGRWASRTSPIRFVRRARHLGTDSGK
jgi:hypothetical protein